MEVFGLKNRGIMEVFVLTDSRVIMEVFGLKIKVYWRSLV